VDLQVEAIEDVTPDVSRMVPMRGGVRMNVTIHKPGTTTATMAAGEPSAVIALDSLPTLHCGDVVEAPMRMKIPERYRDAGAWQYADYWLAQGIGAHASVRASEIALLHDNGRWFEVANMGRSIGADAVQDLRSPELGLSASAGLRTLTSKPSPAKDVATERERRRHAERDALRRPGGVEQDAARGVRTDGIVSSFCRIGNARWTIGRADLLACAAVQVDG